MRLNMANHFDDSAFIDFNDAIDGLDASTSEMVDALLLDVPDVTAKMVAKDDQIYRLNDNYLA